MVYQEVSKRFGNIEQKLEELAASMQKVVPTSNSPRLAVNASEDISDHPRSSARQVNGAVGIQNNFKSPRPHPSSRQLQTFYRGSEDLPSDVVEDGIVAYFTCFHAQPYNLMCQNSSLGPNCSLDPLVLNPMLALSFRCSSHNFWADQQKTNDWIRALTEISWRDLMHRYGEGDTSLEYLQGLCLLAQVDFADGRVQRAHTQISLGVRIAQSLGYLSESTETGNEERSEEVIRCTWTLFMLDRTFSITRLVSPSQPYQAYQLPKPTWEGALLLDKFQRGAKQDSTSKIDPLSNDQDLSALLVGVYSLWDDAIRYVFQATNKSDMPPWHPTSDLATIEYRFADFEPAIAATIQLEHTLSKHADVAAAATLSFRSAIRYLRKLSKYWNSIAELLGIVEELAARLRHRHTLYYSQDDYDGILPVVESERVGLAGDDMSLMWKVFDYASMSALQGKSPRPNASTENASQDIEPHTSQPQGQTGPSNNINNLPATGSDWGNLPSNNMPSTSLDFQNIQGPQTGLEQPNLSLFDQIPEDWAFTIDDWTLFGAPGSTYFYNEAP
ncbi:hypothetical protein IFR05_009674 [Cadophora sp. M221]|nr:hypothetical protein IFR05_009674 [Cadophora sp. M221]